MGFWHWQPSNIGSAWSSYYYKSVAWVHMGGFSFYSYVMQFITKLDDYLAV